MASTRAASTARMRCGGGAWRASNGAGVSGWGALRASPLRGERARRLDVACRRRASRGSSARCATARSPGLADSGGGWGSPPGAPPPRAPQGSTIFFLFSILDAKIFTKLLTDSCLVLDAKVFSSKIYSVFSKKIQTFSNQNLFLFSLKYFF